MCTVSTPKTNRKATRTAPANPFGPAKRPIIITPTTGVNYLDDAFAFLKSGGDTLDAALRVVKGPEDDPNDDTVGLGAFRTKKEWWNSMPAACMGRRAAPDRWAASATLRMFRSFLKL